MAKQYLRKASVGERYGINPRSVDRWVADEKIPRPIYLNGSRIPLWDTDELDANDREAAARARAVA
jgi:predicted DNA-binding transcriptional regulator AlpA